MFSKDIDLRMDFNDFMQLWGELVATLLALGVPWGLCGRLWASFGPVLGHLDVDWQV